MAKKYTKQSESGEGGIALIDQRVTAMGYIWHPRRTDHGIDGEIELVDRAERRPLNRTISVQSKARERFPGEDGEQFHYVCDEDDAAYWSEGTSPSSLSVASKVGRGVVGASHRDPEGSRARRTASDRLRQAARSA